MTLAMAACGGDGDDDGNGSAPAASTPVISASSLDTYGGAAPLTFTGGDANTRWTLSGPGTLAAAQGANTSYLPPSTVTADTQAIISASNGGATASKVVTLHAARLNPVASGVIWYVGDGAVTLTATPAYTDATPTWTVSGGGALSATQGREVQYTPPMVAADAEAVVSVSGGGVTESVRIALAPASEKTLQLSRASVQAGTSDTVRLTVPSAIAHGALTWSASLGTVVGQADGTAIYTPPAVLGAAAVANVTATDGVTAPFTGAITVTASPTLSVTPSVASTTAASGRSISLTASVAGANVVANWGLSSGPGSLSAASGSSVTYTPDAGATAQNITAVVTAVYGGLTKDVTISLNFQSTSTFDLVNSVAIDPAGNLYVADYSAYRKITPAGVVSTISLPASPQPRSVTTDSAGNWYAAVLGGPVYKITPSGTQTTLSLGACPAFNDIPAMAVDSAGSLFLADWNNMLICKVDASGTGSVFASGVNGVWGLAVDGADNVYVTTAYTGQLLKFTPGGVMTVVASGLDYPTGLTVDAAGNAYIGGRSNYLVYKVTPAGVTTTVAGSTRGLVDGLGTAAAFATPTSLAIDAAGNLYVADSGSSLAVRMVAPNGLVTTIAGRGVIGNFDGTALPRAWPPGE